MELSDSFDTDTLKIDKIVDELSENSDNLAYSEKPESISIGELQHEMKMLSIKVLEKDIEIKNLKAEAAINQHSSPLTILEEKLHSLTQANEKQEEDLKSAENEQACFLERVIKAEALEEELKKCKQSCENRLPLSLFEQLRAFEVSRKEQETSELKKELTKLHLERDGLIQRLHVAETEKKRLREDLHSVYSGSLTSQPTDVLTKTRVISLEIQLNAANVAKTDALRRVNQLTEKFEAASKTIYELDAARKVEISRLEAQLSVASQKLATYERLEAELDRAIERFASSKIDEGSDVTDELFHLANMRDRNGNPLLPTLASRRLEHCIQLAQRTAAAEETKRELQLENEGLKNELEVSTSNPCI
ncbi:unnamed protein product [Hymenolepis diminuta]|uniref:HOOK domain-containing protein n=1 Tax=Hymenolepis diminuta TaxID=6216 RepID=A0A0R3SKT0_HYMDI|nr:unnamed protein product [Hymenolepis diminuta]